LRGKPGRKWFEHPNDYQIIAKEVVAHLKLSNWKFDRGPPLKPRGECLTPERRLQPGAWRTAPCRRGASAWASRQSSATMAVRPEGKEEPAEPSRAINFQHRRWFRKKDPRGAGARVARKIGRDKFHRSSEPAQSPLVPWRSIWGCTH
jgi:hypothetical protein